MRRLTVDLITSLSIVSIVLSSTDQDSVASGPELSQVHQDKIVRWDVMGSDDERKRTITEGTMAEVITILFHERRDMHLEENSRKRYKIICKIHDDDIVRNILKKQRQD